MYLLTFNCPPQFVEQFAHIVGETATAVTLRIDDDVPEQGVDAYYAAKPDALALEIQLQLTAAVLGITPPVFTLTKVENQDWLQQVYVDLPPLPLGQFFVYGSHYDGRVPASTYGLLVDAATAFGSGHHPTTAGCLEALSELSRHHKITRALDMGCGSGILALAIAKVWHRPVTAIDIDPESVRVTQDNARRNEVATYIAAAVGHNFQNRLTRRTKPYDLIVANILARPLVSLAKDCATTLNHNGYLILSGLMVSQINYVLSAYRGQGLHLHKKFIKGNWAILVLQK